MFIKPNDLFLTDFDRPAFCSEDGVIMLSAFRKDVARYAKYFSTLPDKKIILYIHDDMYLFCVCFMALAQAGKHIVLPGTLKQGNDDFLKDIASTLVSNIDASERFCQIKVPAELSDGTWAFQDMQDVNVSFFTSGSTSTPKEIIKPLKTLFAGMLNINRYSPNQHDDAVVVTPILPHHMYGILWRFLFPLCKGLVVEIETITSPEELVAKQNRYNHVLLLLTPSFMDKLVKYQDLYQFKKNVSAICSSGALLSEETSLGMFEIFGVCPFEIFGSTETGGVAWRLQINGPEWKIFDVVKTELDENDCLKVWSAFIANPPFQMQDAVEMLDEKHFLLLGRCDRLVKIAEKRISLPEMEARLEAHNWIEKAYTLLLEANTLGAVMTLSDAGKEAIKKMGRKELIKALHQYMLQFYDNSTLPKKVRFVFEIPTNPQGKILKQAILPLFDNNLAEPVVENLKQDKTQFMCDLTFLKDGRYFEGHFPQVSILAGVAQVYFASHFIRQIWGDDVGHDDLVKLKFAHLIQPDQRIRFTLNKQNTDYSFSYYLDDQLCSCGTFKTKGGKNG